MQNDQVKLHVLPNGIRVILQPIPHTRTLSIGIRVGAGSVTENPKIMGYSHFLEHMIFKGTQKRDYIAINRDIEKYGGYLNAFTDRHNTFYYAKILGEYTSQALDVLGDIVFSSTFPEAEVAKEKQVVTEEIYMYEDSPDESIVDLFFEHSYPKSFMGWPILGTKKHIKNLKRQDLIAYYNQHYRNQNIIVSAAGNFKEEEILHYFSALPETEGYHEEETPKPNFHYGVGYHEKEVEQAHLAMGVEAFSLHDDDKYALMLFNNIFGASSSSRLYLNIREEKGLCYALSSSISLDAKTGILALFTSTQPKNLGLLTEAVNEEIMDLKRTPVNSEELEIARAQLKSGIIFNQESTSYCMQKNANHLYWYDRVISADEAIQEVEKISLDDINRVYHRIFENREELSAYAIVPHKHGKRLPQEMKIG